MEGAFIRELPLLDRADVLVVGSGPAGLCAAVAAAREGARVVLLERFGAVGGNLTLGHIRTCMGVVGTGTLKDEVGRLLGTGGECIPHNVENAKGALARWLYQAGVTVYLQTPAAEAWTEGDALRGVVASTPQGLARVEAGCTVDATGDGMIAALAGVPCQVGRPGDGLMQPASLLFTIGGVESGLTCTHESDDTLIEGKSYLALCEEASRRGELPEDVTIVRLYGGERPDERLVNATQLCRADGVKPADITRADRELREQICQVVAFLRARVPGFGRCRLLDGADLPGFRETRRMEGEYTLTAEDIAAGRKFPDVVAHNVNFCFDTHNPAGGGQAEDLEAARDTRPYDIPYRCLLPRKVKNLLAAGRCISGTHKAHSSYRVMNICMALGEAAGIAAALSARKGVSPGQVDVREIQAALAGKGIDLFG
ncbi:MAG TPA: FAD-dependent oxidoreductase [Firmicutes bacterium]|nr:FAD-dependent oxidoreductase [Bacillota bacterium]